MARINVSRVMLSPRISQHYTVLRTSGGWQKGKYVLAEPQELDFTGTITVAREKDLLIVPEGDRVKGTMCFHALKEIYVTHKDGSEQSGISDIIVWRGNHYRIVSVSPEIDYGYYKAIGNRMEGS